MRLRILSVVVSPRSIVRRRGATRVASRSTPRGPASRRAGRRRRAAIRFAVSLRASWSLLRLRSLLRLTIAFARTLARRSWRRVRFGRRLVVLRRLSLLCGSLPSHEKKKENQGDRSSQERKIVTCVIHEFPPSDSTKKPGKQRAESDSNFYWCRYMLFPLACSERA